MSLAARRLSAAAAAAFLACSGSAMARPKSDVVTHKIPQTTYNSWAIYWDDATVIPAIVADTASLDELCLFAYQFSSDGKLIPAANHLDALHGRVSTAAKGHARFVITVVNDVREGQRNKLKDPEVVHKVISTPKARAAHIAELSALADKAEGIDIDYEKVAWADAAAFQTFIQELSPVLRAKHKWLSVVVQPKTSDATSESQKKNGVATIDWRAIAPYVDRVKVMAYLYSYPGSPPGSVAPLDWVDQIAAYGLTQVPPEKLSIILHLGGFDWPAGKPGKSIEYAQALALASARQTKLTHDPDVGASYFTYTDAQVPHTVWVEDATGLKEKVRRLKAAGIRSIGFWRLGAGDPAFWQFLRDPQPPTPSPSL
jgi:spore germination protein YaaH